MGTTVCSPALASLRRNWAGDAFDPTARTGVRWPNRGHRLLPENVIERPTAIDGLHGPVRASRHDQPFAGGSRPDGPDGEFVGADKQHGRGRGG